VTSACHDGVVNPELGEQCDDGNFVSGDGCSKLCQVETEYCGDGIVQSTRGEQCDDGNHQSEDGCSACVLETCGDGTVQATRGEECDDGGQTDGDGCDASCLLEAGSRHGRDVIIERTTDPSGSGINISTSDMLHEFAATAETSSRASFAFVAQGQSSCRFIQVAIEALDVSGEEIEKDLLVEVARADFCGCGCNDLASCAALTDAGACVPDVQYRVGSILAEVESFSESIVGVEDGARVRELVEEAGYLCRAGSTRESAERFRRTFTSGSPPHTVSEEYGAVESQACGMEPVREDVPFDLVQMKSVTDCLGDGIISGTSSGSLGFRLFARIPLEDPSTPSCDPGDVLELDLGFTATEMIESESESVVGLSWLAGELDDYVAYLAGVGESLGRQLSLGTPSEVLREVTARAKASVSGSARLNGVDLLGSPLLQAGASLEQETETVVYSVRARQ
jgi:cysteine-rich repeat protein